MRAVLPWLLAAGAAAAAQPLFTVVDLAEGAAESVKLSNGKIAAVKLLAVHETRDSLRAAVRSAEVEVEIDGARARLACGNYTLPVRAGAVQADCNITKGYYGNSGSDQWGLEKDARIRLWPAGSPWMPPGSMTYPARQRWFATHTQMANEPTYVDGGESFRRERIYYHAGLDIGGAEGMVDVAAATEGQVVALGTAVLEGQEAPNSPVEARYDRIYVLDERGWYHGYIHLVSFDASVKLGGRVRMGRKIGTLGKEGTSGGWSHLHYQIQGRQPSGKWGMVEGYAFLWEAYQREHRPDLIAVARPHVPALAGEKVTLDGSRSWARDGIRSYEWTFTSGGSAPGARVERTYDKPGTYSEILKITDKRGRVAYDFATVNVLDARRRDQRPPAIHAAYAPSMNLKPGREIAFQVRTFGTTEGEETWDFGDGSAPASTKSDGNVKALAKDGYAIIRHTYAEPGDYLVRVERSNGRGEKAVARLHVRVGQ
jgi:murein DD-endopeptidase MepM/ murein hydrolase activator NlpD